MICFAQSKPQTQYHPLLILLLFHSHVYYGDCHRIESEGEERSSTKRRRKRTSVRDTDGANIFVYLTFPGSEQIFMFPDHSFPEPGHASEANVTTRQPRETVEVKPSDDRKLLTRPKVGTSTSFLPCLKYELFLHPLKTNLSFL